MCYNSWYISLPSSTMTKICVVWFGENEQWCFFSNFVREFNATFQIQCLVQFEQKSSRQNIVGLVIDVVVGASRSCMPLMLCVQLSVVTGLTPLPSHPGEPPYEMVPVVMGKVELDFWLARFSVLLALSCLCGTKYGDGEPPSIIGNNAVRERFLYLI